MSLESGNRVRDVRKSAGLSQAEFAEKLNVSLVTVNRIENGHRDPDTSILLKLADLYNADPGWLLLGVKSEGRNVGVSVPIYDSVSLGRKKEERRATGYMSYPAMRDEYFVYEMSDDSMAPRFHQGDYLIIKEDELSRGDFGIFLNQYSIVEVRQMGEKDSAACLIPANVNYPAEQLTSRHQLIGKVISALRPIPISSEME